MSENNETKDVSQSTIEILANSVFSKEEIAAPAHLETLGEKEKYIMNQRKMLARNFAHTFTAKENADGKVAFYLDGEIQINPKTAELATVDEIIKNHYKLHIAPPKEQRFTKAPAQSESFLESKAEVIEFLKRKFKPKGITQGHKEFNAEYSRICTQQGIKN